jgi:phage shock protein PspC (stress-responsive transcriptional regulator)
LGGHYLYVDRNLIELLAACVIATTGTGKWVGVDAYLSMWVAWYRRRADRAVAESDVTVSAR